MEPNSVVEVLVVERRESGAVGLADVLQEILGQISSPHGVRVVSVSSGKEAIERLSSAELALIVLDARKPARLGWEIGSAIKARDRDDESATPILFVIDEGASRDEVREAYAHGAADHATSPLLPEIVAAKIALFVALHRQRQRLKTSSFYEHPPSETYLQASEEHFRLMAEAIPQLVWTADSNGAVDYRNHAWIDYVGDELDSARSNADLVHQDDVAAMTERWTHSKRTGEAFETVYRLRRHDGDYRWFLARAEPLREASGKVVKWFGTCTDIDAEKRSDQERTALAEKLAAERALLTTVLSQMPSAVAITDALGQMILSNEQTTTIFRQPPANEGKQGWGRFVGFHADGHPIAPDEWALARSLSSGEVVRGEEVDILRGDGTRGAIRIYSAPVRDEGGKIVAGVVTFDDVSEEKRAHDALLTSEQRLQAILDSATSVIYLKDLEGRHIMVNRQYEAITGFPRERLLGKFDEEIVGAEVGKLFRDADQQVIATGNPLHLEHSFVYQGEERTYLTVKFPVRDGVGKIYAIGGMSTDITDRRRAEDRLRFLAEASKSFASSLDVMATLKSIASFAVPRLGDWCAIEMALADGTTEQIAVAHVDPKKVEHAWELRRLYPPNNDAVTGVPNVLRTGQSEMYPEISDEMLVAGALDAEHLRLSRELGLKSALIVPIRTAERTHGAFTLVSAESGRVYNALDLALAEELGARAGLALDNARLYEEAKQAIRIRDDFLSVASHELKTPLTAMRLQLTSVARAARSSEAILETVRRAHSGLDRLSRLVEELLDVSRITAGRLQLTRAPVDLASLVRQIISSFSDEWQRAGCEVVIRETGDTKGTWDANRLEQIVTNLVVNACKFGKGAPVEVAVIGGDDGLPVRLSVTDHGIGISKDDQRRIFERFERAVSSRHYGGLGLGLWISRQIVEAHGGAIAVSSEVGEGATFTVTLPREETSAELVKSSVQ